MATKTNNLGLSKAELTDAVKSTLIANNDNFDKIDDANYSLEKQTERLRANQISNTANGFEIELESDLEMESKLNISGNSEQDSRSGKNLLKKGSSFETRTSAGITFTVNEDESITLNGKNDGTANSVIYLWQGNADNTVEFKAGTYNSFRTGNSDITITAYNGSSYPVLARYNTDGFTLDSDTEFRTIYLQVGKGSGYTFDNFTIYPIVTASENSIEPYEPYGVMPSPEFPSEIRSVKSKSDNLLDANTKILNLYFDTSTKKFIENTLYRSVVVEAEPNATYTLSRQTGYVADFSWATSKEYPVINGDITNFKTNWNTETLVTTATTGSDDKYLLLYFAYNKTEEECRGYLAQTQIVKGDKALPHQPYGTPSEAVNLFDETEVKKGYYLSKDNVLVASNYTNMSGYIPVKGNATYTFSYDYTTLSHEGARDCFFLDYDKKILVSFPIYVTDADKKLTIKPSRDCYLVICYDKNFTNIKLTKEVRGYVPVEAKVEGKNKLEDTNKKNVESSGITFTYNSDGTYTANGTNNGNYNTAIYLNSSLTLPAGKYYTIPIENSRYSLTLYDGKSYIDLKDNNTSFELTEETTFRQVYFQIPKGLTANNFTFYPILATEPITKEDYEPYVAPATISLPLGDIELNEIDGVRDTFCKVNRTWNKVSRMFKHSFTKNDGCYLDNTKSTDKKRLRFLVDPVAISAGTSEIKPILSNIGKAVSRDDSYNLKEGFSYDNSQRLVVYFEEASSLTKAVDYAQWLSNKGAYIIYLLSAPIYTPITDLALIQALDELEQLVLHKGYSRITVTSVNGVKAYLDLQYHTSTEKEINRVEAELTQEIDDVRAENAKLTERVAKLEANQPKGTASGTEIVVEDSAEMESKLNISGNSEQDSRSGKNLFDYKDTEGKVNLYSTVDNEGWITTKLDNSSGTSTEYGQFFTNNLKLKTSTQYALFVEIKELSGNPSCEFASIHSTSQNVTNTYTTNVSVGLLKFLINTKDSFEGATNGIRTVVSFNAGKNASITYRISVLEDTSISKENFVYEPYGVMPSPDYPSEIRSVSGDVEAKVEGKNLLKTYANSGSITAKGVTITQNSDGTLTLNGTCTGDVWAEIISGFKNTTDYKNEYAINLDPQKQYTLKLSKISGNATASMYLGVALDIGEVSAKNVGVGKVTTFTNSKGISRGFLRLYANDTFNNLVIGLQLVEGTYTADTMPEFEPYKIKTLSLPLGDIELRSTPDGTRDTFARVDGVWNKVEKIMPFTITEDMVARVNLTYYGVPMGAVLRPRGTIKDFKINICLMTSYSQRKGTEKKHGIFSTGGAADAIEILNENITDLATAKTILAGETGIIKRAEPTYIPITDTALIQALDTLEQLILHKGYNRITVTSVNGVKAYLDLSYTKDINTVLNNIITKLGGL